MQHPLMADVEGRPVLVASCPWFDAKFSTGARIRTALIDAVREALRPLAAADEPPSCTALVNLPLTRPGLPDDLVERIRRDVMDAFPTRFEGVAVAARGHAGALMALRTGISALKAATVDACIVAGSDSYFDLESLEWLEETEQLHGAGRRNNAWGFVPGEAAGAILILRADNANRLGLPILARIAAVGLGHEDKLIRTGSVCLGLGLTGAFREVFAHLSRQRVTDTYCDMNGEPYRADEYGFAVTRTREHFVAPDEFVAPADCWGDVGAASAPLGVLLAVIALQKAYAKGDVALVWASSDTGERGAALVTID
jgi:3-oxoacyl-[acyl-carrier-protein] synthase-1